MLRYLVSALDLQTTNKALAILKTKELAAQRQTYFPILSMGEGDSGWSHDCFFDQAGVFSIKEWKSRYGD